MLPPNSLTAIEAAQKIRDGSLTSVELVTSCLKRIEETDGQIQAWAHLDPAHALAQAEKLDEIRRSGKAVGSLHGVPVGLKDIIDTKVGPTQYGSKIFDGRQADTDAAIVERLIEAGAVIMGKTVTTEFAFMHPSKTKNPHNIEHTPGGSSAGSAAAVAGYHVPLAIGTQTNGSVVRPASFCGIFGMKPTSGIISRRGILQTSKTLDQVGALGRSLEDVALLIDAISCYDPLDQNSFARPRPKLLQGARQEVPVEPDFAILDLPYSAEFSDATNAGLEEILSHLSPKVERFPSPPAFVGLIDAHKTIHLYEYCIHMQETLDAHWVDISSTLKPLIETGRKITENQYVDALELVEQSRLFFSTFFNDFDAIITPSALGEAPKLSVGTGNPICSTVWTVAGLPCLSIPLLVGENNLPIGVQLVGPVEQDDRLMRTANWLINSLETPEIGETNVI